MVLWRFSPAYVPNAITVGSTDSRDRRSSFSNYGRCTNIWAPGSAVKSLGHRGDTATATFSGTSMACPHVSGAAALVLDASQGTAPAKVLQKMLDEAFTGAITDLKSGDTNHLLNAQGLRWLARTSQGGGRTNTLPIITTPSPPKA